MAHFVAWVAVASCLAGACGSQGRVVTDARNLNGSSLLLPDYKNLGRCDLVKGQPETLPAASWWGTASWTTVAKIVVDGSEANPPIDRTVPLDGTFDGGGTTPFFAHVTMAKTLVEADQSGLKIYATQTTSGKYTRYVDHAIAFDDEGRFAFLGECASSTSTAFADQYTVLSANPGSNEELIAEAMNSQSLKTLSPVTTTTTSAVPGLPAPQFVDSEFMSNEELAQYPEARLILKLPATWSALKSTGVVCTAIAEGWNECTPLASAESDVIELHIRTNSTYGFDVWVLDPNGTIASPWGRLGGVSRISPSNAPRKGASTLIISGRLLASADLPDGSEFTSQDALVIDDAQFGF